VLFMICGKILYRLTGQTWHKVYELCMLDTLDYSNTARIHNTYCLSTARTVVQTRLSVTL
jgi:hypothetical protein